MDTRIDAQERAARLLGKMTLREKCFQLTSVPPWYFVTSTGERSAQADEYLEKAPGFIANFGVDDPVTTAKLVAEMQRLVTMESRLGVPLLLHAEALNGFLAGGHMVFPTPTGLAATFSPDLVEEMADVIRIQMHRVGIRQALSPVLDVALDPRWGRFHETYGEDPYLAAALGVAYTRGLQTGDLRNGVIATAKHFLGYSSPQGGMNLSAHEGGPRRLRDLFAYPFEAAINVAGLASVMNSYSDVDGVPAAASPEILTGLLRDVLGFQGFVSSDYSTLQHLVDRQKSAADAAEAARLTIAAGLDTEFPIPFGYGDTLAEEVAADRIPLAHVDRSAHRILEAKFRLGLFENPYPAERIDLVAVAEEGKELSHELARRSVVLAANDGTLPLTSPGARIAVIGPHSDAVTLQFPTYSYPAFREMTTFMSSGGMGNMVGIDPDMRAWNDELLPEATVESFVRDRLGATSLADAVAQRAHSTTAARGCGLVNEADDAEMQRAVDAAAAADIVVLALGGASLWFNGERTEGEASDSADVSLPASQVLLAEAVAATGTPVVAVLFQGRPYVLPQVVLDARAIVIAPYGGPFGPEAVAEVLFGEINPSGKLPYSVPRHGGQIPIYHHQRAGTGYRNPLPPDVSRHYLDHEATPLFTFGHGISYTVFDLSDARAAATAAIGGKPWSVGVDVSNVGVRPGATTVQLYARVNAVGVTRPAQQLIGFARVELDTGSSCRVTFDVDPSLLGFTGMDGRFGVEPCRVDYFLGFDADDRRQAGSFDLAGERQLLSAAERVFASIVTVVGEHAK